jgi:hypothetical protein
MLFLDVEVPRTKRDVFEAVPVKYRASLVTYACSVRSYGYYPDVMRLIVSYIAPIRFIDKRAEFESAFDYMRYWTETPLLQQWNPLTIFNLNIKSNISGSGAYTAPILALVILGSTDNHRIHDILGPIPITEYMIQNRLPLEDRVQAGLTYSTNRIVGSGADYIVGVILSDFDFKNIKNISITVGDHVFTIDKTHAISIRVVTTQPDDFVQHQSVNGITTPLTFEWVVMYCFKKIGIIPLHWTTSYAIQVETINGEPLDVHVVFSYLCPEHRGDTYPANMGLKFIQKYT